MTWPNIISGALAALLIMLLCALLRWRERKRSSDAWDKWLEEYERLDHYDG